MLQIGGLVRSSLVDYPGRVAAVVFLQGCNFRCPYCHNPDLVVPQPTGPQPPAMVGVLDFLERRRGLLEGVVVTGGEPSLQADLLPFLRTLKDYGYLVKLDTNGSRPKVLRDAVAERLVDYFAMDLKAPLSAYSAATGVETPTDPIRESLRVILDSGCPHEFRTTAVHPLHTPEDLVAIGKMAMGADRFVLQRFVNRRLLDPSFSQIALPFEEHELVSIQSTLLSLGVACVVR